MKKLFFFAIFLVSAMAQAQCTKCGGSRVDVSFTTATLTDTNGVDSTITGEFIFILDFKNSKCKYFKDGVLQWQRNTQYYGIFKENKHFAAYWNIEKNPGLDVISEKITLDIKNNSVVFIHGLMLEHPLTISCNNAKFTVYK